MKWIPVNEKLPDCDDKWGISKVVLCLDARGRVGFGIYQNGEKQLYHAGWFTGGSVGEDSVTITHWMPLPELPMRLREEARGVSYNCLNCRGDGYIEMHSPEVDYIKSCPECGGTGKRQITIQLQKYDLLKAELAHYKQENEQLQAQVAREEALTVQQSADIGHFGGQ